MRAFSTWLLRVIVASQPAHAEVTVYTNKANWHAAVPAYSTITFTELPANTFITDQYSSLGVQFTDGSDTIYNNPNAFVDGFGLNGAFNETTLEFDIPMTTIAMDFPGTLKITLYANNELIYVSPIQGVGWVGNFAGIVSTVPFDKVFINDPFIDLFVDNIYFGPPIPAPHTLALAALSIATLRRTGRRRRLA